MQQSLYRDEIRFLLTGNVLECELDNAALDKVIESSLREIQRYIDSTKLITVPFKSCINLLQYKVNSVSNVYRTEGFAQSTNDLVADPMLAAQWQLMSGSLNMLNFDDYAYNYLAYNTMLQIRNTTTTDLAFKFVREENNLYINVSNGQPLSITIEYVPVYQNVEDVDSDYWIDMIMRMLIAKLKIAVGRIRSRYTQSNLLWLQDGDKVLEEGTSELSLLREYLQTNTALYYPID